MVCIFNSKWLLKTSPMQVHPINGLVKLVVGKNDPGKKCSFALTLVSLTTEVCMLLYKFPTRSRCDHLISYVGTNSSNNNNKNKNNICHNRLKCFVLSRRVLNYNQRNNAQTKHSMLVNIARILWPLHKVFLR